MSYELIITEKPAAAKKIAEALADGKPIKENINKVPFYKITHGNQDIVVVCAVGHLFGLTETEKKGWTFPVFDITWKPSADIAKGSKFTRKYLNVIKKLSKDASSFTVATDYDQEGEVIGLNVVLYACKQKDAQRMKFSTLTKNDLVSAYANKSAHLDWGQANAGVTRHSLDWYNGINYSRALTAAIKTTGGFKLMSTGRVQGPALKIIVDKEREIKAFEPVPYWRIQLDGVHDARPIEAWHKEDKFWEKEKADAAFEKTKDAKDATVVENQKKQFQQKPPTPFDLTSLQVEAHRVFKIAPKSTLSVCQELYTAGFISYPRTSSQQLPESIKYNKILKDLSRQSGYAQPVAKLVAEEKPLKPNNGKKTDPAHPAIYPTGEVPKGLDAQEGKIYDLIVKRFFATFAKAATRETSTIDLDCKSEPFVLKGTRTVDAQWHVYYAPYVKVDEDEIPNLPKGSVVDVTKIELLSEETKPPKRYTPASIIKALEKHSLGTKATRSEIVDTLFKRGYVEGKSITATELGIRTVETLEKHAPKIIDVELTRRFEEETEKVFEGKLRSEDVLGAARTELTEILTHFKQKQAAIGEELAKANKETQFEMNALGDCSKCDDGVLMVRKGRFGNFAACNKYPDCKTTVSLPNNAIIRPAKKMCETCDFPMVLVIKGKKRPQELCLNKECPSKKVEVEGKAEEEVSEEIKKKIEEKEGSQCPKCSKGTLKLRSSIYGKFFGCDKFPRCRYTEPLVEREGGSGGFSKRGESTGKSGATKKKGAVRKTATKKRAAKKRAVKKRAASKK